MSRRGPSRWDNNNGRDHTTGSGSFRQRQRQREDHRPAPYNTQRPTGTDRHNNARGGGRPGGVSDEDAIQALMQSAQQREQEKKRSDARSRRPDSDRNRGSNGQRPPRDQQLPENESYYGPAPGEAGRSDKGVDEKEKGNDEESTAPPAQKPNFGLSGALAKDSGGTGGNMYKGIQLKFHEPPEARAPNTQWRFYVFKGKDQLLETLHISKQSAYLMGRQQEICDIPMAHPSLSSQHAVLQYRALPHPTTQRLSCRPYIMDLESTNGTFLNSVRLDPARYYELKKGDVLTFGASTREYVLMTENTTGSSME
eukprot:Nitzschia sp. Nitz4//scaffold63_size106090//38115//39047//NITZ4_004386-RA/size106090-processed-gene-0.140-mRNA-1//-1//CDS//3329555963//5983//frame0